MGPNATNLAALFTDVRDAAAPKRNKAFARLAEIAISAGHPTAIAEECVPWLLDVVASLEVKDRGRLLMLLADLACDGDHLRALEGGPRALSRTAIQATLTEHAERVLPLLGDKASAVRAAVAVLLGVLPDVAGRAAPLLRQQLVGEKDDAVRASLLIAGAGYMEAVLAATFVIALDRVGIPLPPGLDTM